MAPQVVVIQDWPTAMRIAVAAQYMEMSEAQFRRVVCEYPHIVQPFNYLPGGDTYYDRADLDRLKEHRKAAGLERKTG